MNILVCDDDKEIVRAIETYLKNAGYNVLKAYDGKEAVDIVNTEEVHLLIIDIMMPGMDGIEVTQIIREKHNFPIIMLSAKSEDYDKIDGLSVGADDYVTKPFNPMELIARVKSQLRRYTMLGSVPIEGNGIYRTGTLVVDDNAKTVSLDGEQVAMTPKEFGIIKLLIKNPGKVFSIEEIYENVWNEPAIIQTIRLLFISDISEKRLR